MFIEFDEKGSNHVTYGDNTRGKILGEGVMRNPFTITVEGVLLVEGIKHNLLSIIQLCEKDYSMFFYTLSWLIEHKESRELVFKGSRIDNIYMLDMNDVLMHGAKYLVTKNGDSWLWHRRSSHMHFDLINKITSMSLVIGLPKIKFSKDKLCNAYQMGKKMRVSFKSKKVISTSKPLELPHIDFFGPLRKRSLRGNYYKFVIMDNYSRFTWTLFLAHKAFVNFSKLV